MKKLFLDDVRTIDMVYQNYNPEDWVLVRNYHEFVNYIQKYGLPEFISFDHDLGVEHMEWFFNNGGYDSLPDPLEADFIEKTGYDAAKWLCSYVIDNDLKLPDYAVHSANPIGRKNIISYLENFKKHTK